MVPRRVARSGKRKRPGSGTCLTGARRACRDETGQARTNPDNLINLVNRLNRLNQIRGAAQGGCLAASVAVKAMGGAPSAASMDPDSPERAGGANLKGRHNPSCAVGNCPDDRRILHIVAQTAPVARNRTKPGQCAERTARAPCGRRDAIKTACRRSVPKRVHRGSIKLRGPCP